MKKHLLLIVVVAIIALTYVNFQPVREDIADNDVIQIITPFITTPPDDLNVLFHQQINDDRESLSILTIITQSQSPYKINKGTELSINFTAALNAIKVDLPDYDFGEAKSEFATSYRWEEKNQQWGITSIETSKGYFSRWQRIVTIE